MIAGDLLFGRVEIGGIRWQIQARVADLFDQFTRSRGLVKRGVVHHDDRAGDQPGSAFLLQPRIEPSGVTRPFAEQRRQQSITQGGAQQMGP